MTDRFVALPVGQGDAFFLQRGTFAALIDGGRSRHAFSTLFCVTLNRKSIDVLVCTHNDADHADGVLGFLESGLSCGEVWLPALWQDRLDNLLKEPGAFLDELIRDVRELPLKHDESDERVRLDLLGDRFADDDPQANDEESNIKEDGQLSEPVSLYMENDDDGNTVPAWPWWFAPSQIPEPSLLFDIEVNGDSRRWQLLYQALSAANRIRDIAIACAHRGVPIRWFRHSPNRAKGGKNGMLTSLNAVEIAGVIPRHISALRWLALSTANRLSLTFCLPPQDNHPGAVFTADSDLRFSAPIPWRRNMIVTAPHHGSEANKSAYARFRSDIQKEFEAIWVRSDGHFKSRPGSSYLGEPRRFCTLCRTASHPRQAVRFAVKNGRWAPIKSRRCVCQ